ncbi:hypothetical protein PanWU01x14_145550 [Parasponia andersonii]|uniref:Uncharacterized protein n=1 Tax=Parasponia andersonii TaxID=3476 RepID=A0A2P5CKB1_PARAD|nr:hypothetical protein PanWU01x14_145550 [Parasponia andersonii]
MKKEMDLLERIVAEIHAKFFIEQYAPGPCIAAAAIDKGMQETTEKEEAANNGAEHKETTAQQDYSAVQNLGSSSSESAKKTDKEKAIMVDEVHTT